MSKYNLNLFVDNNLAVQTENAFVWNPILQHYLKSRQNAVILGRYEVITYVFKNAAEVPYISVNETDKSIDFDYLTSLFESRKRSLEEGKERKDLAIFTFGRISDKNFNDQEKIIQLNSDMKESGIYLYMFEKEEDLEKISDSFKSGCNIMHADNVKIEEKQGNIFIYEKK